MTVKAPPFIPPTAPSAPTDFGPDPSTTPADPEPIAAPKPKREPKPSPLSGLGTNRAVRSKTRKLTEDDRERIHAWYVRIGKISAPFHGRLAAALHDQAEDCTNAWFQLADSNDKVRKTLLAIIEGGDWGAVITAHVPLFMAFIPERVIERIMLRGMGLFASHVSEEDLPSTEPYEGKLY